MVKIREAFSIPGWYSSFLSTSCLTPVKLRSRQSADVGAEIGVLKETREEVGPQQQLRPAAQEKATELITDDAAGNVPAWSGTEVGERLERAAQSLEHAVFKHLCLQRCLQRRRQFILVY